MFYADVSGEKLYHKIVKCHKNDVYLIINVYFDLGLCSLHNI